MSISRRDNERRRKLALSDLLHLVAMAYLGAARGDINEFQYNNLKCLLDWCEHEMQVLVSEWPRTDVQSSSEEVQQVQGTDKQLHIDSLLDGEDA